MVVLEWISVGLWVILSMFITLGLKVNEYSGVAIIAVAGGFLAWSVLLWVTLVMLFTERRR